MNNLVWTDEVEGICEHLRINCVNLAEYHRKRYYHFKSYGKYFRIPAIILASITSTASIGLQPVLEQGIISGITCLLGMAMGILSAIEIYMGIQNSMELELKQSKEFYTLAIDLYKTLTLTRENRSEHGKDYLNKKYGQYTKMVEASNLLKRSLKVDLLTEIPKQYKDYIRTPTSQSTLSSQQSTPVPSNEMELQDHYKTENERLVMVNTDLYDVDIEGLTNSNDLDNV